MSKRVAEWLREGEHLWRAGLAECRAIDDRIAQLERLRGERWAAVEAVGRVLGRSSDELARVPIANDVSGRSSRAVRATSGSTRDAIAGAFGIAAEG